MEIEIPDTLTDMLLTIAAEEEISVEELVERASKNYMERNDGNVV